jgi:hypothetical protein
MFLERSYIYYEPNTELALFLLGGWQHGAAAETETAH